MHHVMSPVPVFTLAALAALVGGCAGSPTAAEAPPAVDVMRAADVVRAADVEWQALNPARGDASPRAATLWGDRAGSGPTGFLVRFADGFSSPPHIHNVSYRGVVLSGAVHNADAAAEPLWMPVGSFWTQPKGGAHITASRGESVAYIEIDEGPYLVRPVDAAFATDEKPLNVHARNRVWVPVDAVDGARVAYLWGAPRSAGPSGSLVELPADAAAALRGGDSAVRAVLVEGRIAVPGESAPLEPGSAVRADGALPLTCHGPSPCLLYVGTAGAIDVAAAP